MKLKALMIRVHNKSATKDQPHNKSVTKDKCKLVRGNDKIKL